jgi:DNA polymerase I-like protein with 3'-5' exonuclease and polymerase domains
MRTFDLKLGRLHAVVHYCPPGTFDRTVFATLFPMGGLYGVDMETTYMTDLAQWDPDFRVRTVQFATEDYAWVLDMADLHQRLAAVELLVDRDTWFCSHNNMDVLTAACALDVRFEDRNVDTLVLANMAYTEKLADRDLKSLSGYHLGPELGEAEEALHKVFHTLWMDKLRAEAMETGKRVSARSPKGADVQALGWSEVPVECAEYLIYGGLDAIACRRLLPILAELTDAPRRLVDIEVWLAAQANKIQLRGMLVDHQLFGELHTESTAARDALKEEFIQLTGVNPQGPKVVPWFAEHGADWSRWESMGGALTDTGKPSLAKDNVALIGMVFSLDSIGRAALGILIEFKSYLDRAMKTDGIKSHLAPDGRIHPVLKTNGATQTSRMSSTGPNMQNFSKKDWRTRGCFIPEPGHVLISADFSQVELRVVAALAGETKMIEAIKAGDDLHQLTADLIGQPRPIGKMANFLTVYGGGGKALASQAGIERRLADEVVRSFKDGYEKITEYNEELMGYRSYIRTCTGRKLAVSTYNGQPKTYANINFMVQSTSRDLLVDAWYRLATEYGRGEMVWYAVHDELVLMVPEHLAETVMAEVIGCMTFDFLGVPIEAAAHVLRDKQGVSRWGK